MVEMRFIVPEGIAELVVIMVEAKQHVDEIFELSVQPSPTQQAKALTEILLSQTTSIIVRGL